MKKRNKIKNLRENIPNSFEIASKYGTYEIQPTADTDNEFPMIAQGKPKKDIRSRDCHQPE